MKKRYIAQTKIFKPVELNNGQKDQMYRILISYFDGQTRKEFENDLKEKNWVFVLFESGNGKICGFSTLKMLNVVVEHKTINALFSGDTIFHNGIGRTDLPNSQPEKMAESLEKIKKLNIKTLCPGHNY